MANLDEDEQACFDRWKRFVEMDLEEGLRDAGLTEESVDTILKGRCMDIRKDVGEAMELAVMGRGVDSRDYGLRIGFGDEEDYDPVLGLDKAIALCANLSSNPYILDLVITLGDRMGEKFHMPKMCTLLSDALRTNHTLYSLTMTLEGGNSEAVKLLLLGPRERSPWQTVASKQKEGLAIELGKDPCDDAAIMKLKRDIALQAEKFQIGGLQVNTTLGSLTLQAGHLSDEGVGYVAAFLRTNFTLKILDIHGNDFSVHGARIMADALKHNNTLEDFSFGSRDLKYDATECLLEAFSRNESDGLCNTAVEGLQVYNLTSHQPGYSAVPRLLPLARVIKTNKTLRTLDIHDAEFPKEDWTQQIFPELSRNETLQILSLHGSRDLEGQDVKSALFNLIENSNTGLCRLYLGRNGLCGYQHRVERELERRREGENTSTS